MTANSAEFRVKLISGGRITIPTAVRDLLGVRDGDHIVCSVRAPKSEELPRLKTLWRILKTCRRGLAGNEVAKRCRLPPPATKSYLALLLEEELLSVHDAGEQKAGGETYRTTQKGLQMIKLVVSIRGNRR